MIPRLCPTYVATMPQGAASACALKLSLPKCRDAFSRLSKQAD